MPKLFSEKTESPNWDEDLIKAWYRLGIFMPFFRAHAHIDSIRREPWVFSQETNLQLRDTIRLRYALLVYLYTQFYMSQNEEHGKCSPIIRPLWYEYPTLKNVEDNESTFLFGPAILVQIMPKKNPLPSDLPSSKYEFDI